MAKKYGEEWRRHGEELGAWWRHGKELVEWWERCVVEMGNKQRQGKYGKK